MQYRIKNPILVDTLNDLSVIRSVLKAYTCLVPYEAYTSSKCELGLLNQTCVETNLIMELLIIGKDFQFFNYWKGFSYDFWQFFHMYIIYVSVC